jgi:ankyrin repeat protein
LLETGSFERFRNAAGQVDGLRAFCNRQGDFLLHRAAMKGSREACAWLMRQGLSPVCPGSGGATPLHYAAAEGDVTLMHLLLREKESPHSPVNQHGMTPLHVAAGEGHLAVARYLVKRGADLRARDKFGRLPLHYAAGADWLKVVTWMLQQEESLIEDADAFGQRPFHWAAKFACSRTVNELFQRKADLGASDIFGRSVLFFLQRLDAALPITLPAPLRLAIAVKNRSCRRLTTLQRAIFAGDIREVRRQVKGAETLNRPDDLGQTAVHLAAMTGNRDLFRWMVKKGGDAKLPDDYHWSPIKLLGYRLVARAEGTTKGKA